MQTVNYSTLRGNMKSYFDKVTDDQDTLLVTRKNENVVIMPQSMYDSLMETLYLTGTTANHDHLMRSLSQLREGKAAPHEITED